MVVNVCRAPPRFTKQIHHFSSKLVVLLKQNHDPENPGLLLLLSLGRKKPMKNHCVFLSSSTKSAIWLPFF